MRDYRCDEEKVFTPAEECEHIVNWIKEYFVKNGPDSKAIIGISGGKDSTVAAALCVKTLGADKVLGVLMPQGVQPDIDDARRVCEFLGIASLEINIDDACAKLYKVIDKAIYDGTNTSIMLNPGITSNLPARIRMTTLYAVAAECCGRVCNTCNRSENYVGYSTKYGDHAGDFAPLEDYTVREVLEIGDAIGLPYDLVHKIPSDGMCGSSDEEKLGFTYATLDAFLLDGIVPDCETIKLINQAHKRNLHKIYTIQIPHCRRLNKGKFRF